MINWRNMINLHNEDFNGKCCNDKNPLVFRVKLKNYDVPLMFGSNNKAFGDYGGFSVFAWDENDNMYRIERDLTNTNIESIELVG